MVTPRAGAREWGLAGLGPTALAVRPCRAAWPDPRAGRSAAAAGTASIAVLPFADMSPLKDQEYFADGLAEELLERPDQDPRVCGWRGARRPSSSRAGTKTCGEIGQKLNVATLLEGSVRKAGNQVRISAQLVKVADGFHLWSGTYDRELDDIFAVQDEIARAVSTALKVTLLGTGIGPSAAPEGDGEAYNLYLQAKYFCGRPHRRADLEKAIGYYDQALKLEPHLRPGLGRPSQRPQRAGEPRPRAGRQGLSDEARDEVEKALALDPNLAEAHAALGMIKRTYDWDWAGADAAHKRALELAPGNAAVVRSAARLAATFRPLRRGDRPGSARRRARPLERRDRIPIWAPMRGARVGLEEAEAAFRKALELNPDTRRFTA